MKTKDKTQSLPEKVKESIDFIYNITTEQGGGYRGGFSTFDDVTKRVIAELVKRGIVAKEQDRTKPRTQFVYKWAVGMSPTRALYGSVTDTLRKNRREYQQARRGERKVQASDMLEERRSRRLSGRQSNPSPRRNYGMKSKGGGTPSRTTAL